MRGYAFDICQHGTPTHKRKTRQGGLRISGKLKRNHQQIFRVDDEELALIKQKMDCARIANKEAYYRKMVLDGYVVRLDFSDVRKMVMLLSNATSNLNQISRRLNASGNIFASDIKDIQQNYERLWEQIGEILQKLSKLQT
jgi:uncharacterized lipoprotein